MDIENIVLASAGSLAVGVVALFLATSQIWFALKRPEYNWNWWGALLSLSTVAYAIGIFLEYNTGPGKLNRFGGILEMAAVLFVVHSLYGFTFSYLNLESKKYHLIAGLFHGLVLIFLWFSTLLVSDKFVYRNFHALKNPFVEPDLGPLGPLFMAYAFLSFANAIRLWLKYRGKRQTSSNIYIIGLSVWLVLGAHDALTALGMPAIQYVMEYGFLGFSVSVLSFTVSDYMEMTRQMQDANTRLNIENTERKRAEEALKKHRDHLEETVNERTSELTEINKNLNEEIVRHRETEIALKHAYEKLRDANAQLIQSAKLASIGELASGVAHELNQPLMVIRMTAQVMEKSIRRKNAKIDELSAYLEPIDRNTRRMMNIISHLQVFSRQSRRDFSPVDVDAVIEDCFLMVGEQLRLHHIAVKKELSKNLPMVQGNANQLEQVFLNLITNARDAVLSKAEGPDRKVGTEDMNRNWKGEVKIVTKASNNRIKVSDTSSADLVTNADQSCVEVLVSDNGGGIEAENMGKIFDPFFTTKDVGKGTGLGLSISYGIIKDHQGKIEVIYSSLEGTSFRVLLPVSEAASSCAESGTAKENTGIRDIQEFTV